MASAARLRRSLLASILRRPGDQALPVSSGEAINRFRDDVGEVTDFPTWLPDQAGKILAAVVAVLIMARINLGITLIIFLPLFGIMGVTRLAWGRILHYNRAIGQATDAVMGFLGEAFGAVQAVKIANAEAAFVERFYELSEIRRRAAVRGRLFFGLLDSINSSAVTFGIGVILLLAGQAIAAGTFTLGDFALFVSYLWFTTQVPSELGTFAGDYKTQEVSIQRMAELVRPEPAGVLVEDPPLGDGKTVGQHDFQPKSSTERLERLEVRGLCYHYPGSGVGVENISLDLRRGSFTVITGRIGSGKTTLLRALIGLLPIQAGELFWNGLRVDDPAGFFRPPRCAYTSQVPRLFSETLRENLLMGLPEDRVDLSAAIWMSVMEQDVASLENGLDTLVGPRGVRLSGGQVQRAAAARMFLRYPELLILDDLSSALDVETEGMLWERMEIADRRRTPNAERRKRSPLRRRSSTAHRPSFVLRRPSSIVRRRAFTVLAVSHRRAVLRRADHIIVLKEGKMEAEGKLDELLLSSGEMRRLWKGDYGGDSK
jgi:ATP-binding cassette subfamily B protein